MTSRVTSIDAAFRALGLSPCAGLSAAKTAFRDRVKTLHPDVSTPDETSLSQLADIVAAIRYLEDHLPACLELEIGQRDAARGVTRTLRVDSRAIIVRVPAGTRDGHFVTPVGETEISIRISVRADDVSDPALPGALDIAGLDEFVEEFTRPSANARFANWIRKSQSAA